MTAAQHHVAADTVSTSFAMDFADYDEGQIAATLRYSALEPFAVTATFSLSDSPAVQWVVSRELLREGLVLPSGIGDIRLIPTESGLIIELHSPNGRAVLIAPLQPVVDFLQATYRAVPEGHESDFFSIDAELDLLGDLRR